MAQFRGTIQGQRGEASRLGGKGSGLRVTANGWECGVTVSLEYDEKAGTDRLYVSLTSGSNGGLSSRTLFSGTCEEVRASLAA
jgi:hypothetical protein